MKGVIWQEEIGKSHVAMSGGTQLEDDKIAS
jgi:hypothetical protein